MPVIVIRDFSGPSGKMNVVAIRYREATGELRRRRG
jgi:hypothetical protein